MQAAVRLHEPETGTTEAFGVSCYKMADAMLKAREAAKAAEGGERHG